MPNQATPWWKRPFGGSNAAPTPAETQNADNASEEADDEVLLPPGSTAEGGDETTSSDTETPPADATETATQGEPPVTTTPTNTAPAMDAGLVAALAAAGIATASDFATFQAKAKDGDTYAAEVADDLKAQGIRKWGAAEAAEYIEAASMLPVSKQRKIANSWSAEADEKWGIGQNGTERTPAQRQTAARELPTRVAVDADGPGNGARAWDALPAAAKEQATRMGYTTVAQQDAYADSLAKS